MYNFIQKVDESTWNVICMSLCLVLTLSSESTTESIEKTLVASIHDDNNAYQVNGYNFLALHYITYGISLWLGPSAINVIGLRTSMVVASLIYTIYIGSIAAEVVWILYTVNVLGGIGTSLIWTAEGKYIVSNSPTEVVSRNIGIFWALTATSSIFGNVFTYYQLRGKTYIDRGTRQWIIYGFTTISAVATIAYAFLRAPKKEAKGIETIEKSNPILELKKTWNIFKTKELLILCLPFTFTGLQLAFRNGVYGSSIGFTTEFGNMAKELVPISGILGGVGLIIGGLWEIYQVQYLQKLKWSRSYMMSVGVGTEILSFALIFINIPSTAVFGTTTDKALINSNAYIAVFCSLLLGIGDGFLNVQNFSIVALLFPNDSAQSSALYKFMKAVSEAAGFAILSYLNLYYQVVMLTITGLIGLIGFIYVDREFVHRTGTRKATAEDT